MQTVSIILQIFGAFSGIGVLCVGIRWLYFKLCTKKLYYARKVYPISDRKYMHLISIWNPTYQTVSGNDITQSVCISMLGNEGNFHIIKEIPKHN